MSKAGTGGRPALGRSQPSKLGALDIAGPIFQRDGAKHDGPQRYVNLLESSDRAFSAGFYSSDQVSEDIESYPYDEFCQLTSGSLTLTSSDGSSATYGPGEAAFIPKGWKGRWETPGLAKLYAIYIAGDAH